MEGDIGWHEINLKSVLKDLKQGDSLPDVVALAPGNSDIRTLLELSLGKK